MKSKDKTADGMSYSISRYQRNFLSHQWTETQSQQLNIQGADALPHSDVSRITPSAVNKHCNISSLTVTRLQSQQRGDWEVKQT